MFISMCGSRFAAILMVAAAFPTTGQQANFSFEGDFNALGDEHEFGINLVGDILFPTPYGFQTFANAGGTNRAGDTIASGGIDSILTLTNPFIAADLGRNDDYDTTNHGFDYLLTWEVNGTPSTLPSFVAALSGPSLVAVRCCRAGRRRRRCPLRRR